MHQLACSLIHNYVPLFIKPAFTLAWTRPAPDGGHVYAASPRLPLSWVNTCGPLFGNTIATLLVDGRSAEVLFEQLRGPDALDEVRSAGCGSVDLPDWVCVADAGPARLCRRLAGPTVRCRHRLDALDRDRRSSTRTVASVRATANDASAMRLTPVPPLKVSR